LSDADLNEENIDAILKSKRTAKIQKTKKKVIIKEKLSTNLLPFLKKMDSLISN
jgi:hypothetical protein